MTEKYEFWNIEERWQGEWERLESFRVDETPDLPKYYLLEMFPYPSGRIHMGHVRNYSIGDVIARYKRMRGFNVLHPMGWDAFGLPAENAAIANKVHPARWTVENIDYMRAQLKKMGFSYDWTRELATSDASYYRWEQVFFLEMLKRGLAYKKNSAVNWCSGCQTVLANEQVVDGCCWRCEHEVVMRELPQWFFRITAYAEDLLAGCDELQGWPDKVLTMQRNWIGKSIGAEIRFPLVGREGDLSVFTTRQDTIYGATFVSLAAEHPLALELSKGTPQQRAVEEFAQRVKGISHSRRGDVEMEKEGIFTGAFCLNPFTRETIPIYLANFVLMEYGTGAVMAVPAHDQRDFEFARKYDLPVRPVIHPRGATLVAEDMTEAYTDYGVMADSGSFSGLGSEEGRSRIAAFLEEQDWGKGTVRYRLRDWGISRQRYWGAPIPVVYCDAAAWSRFPWTSCRYGSPPTWSSRVPADRRWPISRSSTRPRVRRAVARPAGRPIPWTRSWNHRGTSRATPVPTKTVNRWTGNGRATGWPWTSTWAASSTRCCTCFMPVSLPAFCGTWAGCRWRSPSRIS